MRMERMESMEMSSTLLVDRRRNGLMHPIHRDRVRNGQRKEGVLRMAKG
jgi:hypothetical protein